MDWRISAKPEGRNSGGKNEGGMVIYLVQPGSYGNRQEIERVAFARENCTHPDVSYEDQLDISIAKARKTIEVLEELTANAGELQ